jgi:hypothetical protein
MKKQLKPILLLLCILLSNSLFAQESDIQTVFKRARHSSGGYGAISNKFTTINGDFANLVEVYGGWYINRRFLLGIGAAATTNDIRVPEEFSSQPGVPMSYEYGQVGMVNEFVIGSNKAVHLAFHLFSGAGFTVQYERHDWHDDDLIDFDDYSHDENWFFVAEPGVQLEVNLFRWLRFSPGVSYRAAFGSDARGLSDNDLSDISYNVSLKFGKF